MPERNLSNVKMQIVTISENASKSKLIHLVYSVHLYMPCISDTIKK